MTLVLGIVRPGDGAWMCSDRRLSDSETLRPLRREADKVFALRCADGPLLLGCAGLAGIDPRNNVLSEWVLQSLRGENRTIEDTLVHLTKRLERDIHAGWRKEPLSLAGVGFVGVGGGWSNPGVPRATGQTVLYQICNVDRSPDGVLSVSNIELRKKAVSQPAFIMLGKGAERITRMDVDRIQQIAIKHPRRPEDFFGLLAPLVRGMPQRIQV